MCWPRPTAFLLLQDLFLFLLASAERPGWVHPKKWPQVRHVVCLTLAEADSEGLATDLFGSDTAVVRCGFDVAKRYQKLTPAAAMLLRPASKKNTKRRKHDANAATIKVSLREGVDQLGWSSVLERAAGLILTEAELAAEGYPHPTDDACQLPSPSAERAAGPRGLVAVDCEMVETDRGDEVVSVVAVDALGVVLYDELVQPAGTVQDYRTEWSGMTADRLQGVETTLAGVQAALCQHLDNQCVLVGHSLNNDLKALGMKHRRCIDTARAYPHKKGPPAKLKLRDLAKSYLLRSIQQGGPTRHLTPVRGST